jgi:hypothetical protein
MIDLNKITLGIAAGAVANMLAGGIGARLAMRAVVLLIGGKPSLTAEGTLGILLLAAILGAVLGLMVAYLHGWAGARWRLADWALGGLLAVLVAWLFFANREGEFALLPAWQVALLFAPLALLSTLATGRLYQWLQRVTASAPQRRAPALWLGAYGIAFIPAFIGMMSLAGVTLRLPRVAWHVPFMGGAAANFAAVYAPMQMLGLLFALSYLLLTWLIFWLANRRALQAAAIGCLLLAAGLFHVNGPLEGVLGRGLAATALEILLALIGAGILAVVYWQLFAGAGGSVRRAPLAFSLLAIAGTVAALVGLMVTQPQWSVLRQPLLVTLFSVTLYLLPWLLLPLGLLLSMRARPGQAASSPVYQPGALADLS